MVQRRMRIGVVGANGGTDRWGARAHLPAIAALEEAELVAVCTAREETARRAQQRTGARLAFWDYQEMVRSIWCGGISARSPRYRRRYRP